MDIEIEVITDLKGSEHDLAQTLAEFWQHQTKDDVRLRFGTFYPPTADRFAALLPNFAVLCLAFVILGDQKILVGHAEAGRFRDQPNWVEISVATDLYFRQQGIAKNLLEATVLSCRSQGIAGIKANVLPYNTKVIGLINMLHQQIPINCHYEDSGYLVYTFTFEESLITTP